MKGHFLLLEYTVRIALRGGLFRVCKSKRLAFILCLSVLLAFGLWLPPKKKGSKFCFDPFLHSNCTQCRTRTGTSEDNGVWDHRVYHSANWAFLNWLAKLSFVLQICNSSYSKLIRPKIFISNCWNTGYKRDLTILSSIYPLNRFLLKEYRGSYRIIFHIKQVHNSDIFVLWIPLKLPIPEVVQSKKAIFTDFSDNYFPKHLTNAVFLLIFIYN